MKVVVLGFVLLLVLTVVHETGHWLAVRLRGGRALRLIVGRGPAIIRRDGPPAVRIGILPFGGRIDYEGIVTPTGQAVVALSGAVANLLLAGVAFGVGALAFDMERVTPGITMTGGAGAPGFAFRAVSSWFWLVPGAIVDLLTVRDLGGAGGSLRFLVQLLVRGDPAAVVYLAGAASALWASLNLLPIPVVGTDGWRALQAVSGFRKEST